MVGSFFHNVSYGRNAFGPFSQRFIRSDFRDVSFGRNESLRKHIFFEVRDWNCDPLNPGCSFQ
jgi:hypothetical protein